MPQAEPPLKDPTRQVLNSLALAQIVGGAGCVTLALVLVSLAAGLWLDGVFHTRPMFTLLLVLGSVPVTMFLMARIALSGTRQLQGAPKPPPEGKDAERTDNP
jgi:hypothetical protein